ncbi:MAG: ATP-dependent DNA helicase RecQ [Oscillatoriales cyanobacterium C42_A2020_001]|nr:ATP-dependent DNA helicase RecQ [Leptolyngbyaceae cyanobacterium C42_A2020_001]
MQSTSTSRQATPALIQSELQRFFGYSNLRSPQAEIVECLLQQHDALIVLPTGAGKSVCFQLPALMQPGLMLVVSPLVALMENQVQELRQRNLPAALLHSELPKNQYRRTLWAVEQQQLRLLYLSPETLLSANVWRVLCQPNLTIQAIVLDEAHCLTQWGETFRPDYCRLGAVRRSLLQHKPNHPAIAVAAFTATADTQTQQTIQHSLQLEQPRVFRLNPHRANLDLTVQTVWTPHQRRQRLLKFLQAWSEQVGLVYVRTRRASEELATWLTQQGYETAAYHAGLSPNERRVIEQGWLNGRLQFVVCTNAFGMGINQASCRWIVHFQAPVLLSEYVQEVGRAGRDGNPAAALMLVSERTGWLDPDDRQRWRYFEAQSQKQVRAAKMLIPKLPRQGDVMTVSRQFPEGAIALSLLHSQGCLEWEDPFRYIITGRSPSKLVHSNIQAASAMKQYLNTRRCRWQFLLSAFGFEAEANQFRCGHCDNCGPSSLRSRTALNRPMNPD